MAHNDPKMNQMQEKRWNIGNGGKKSIFVVGGRSLINVQTSISQPCVCMCVVCVGGEGGEEERVSLGDWGN